MKKYFALLILTLFTIFTFILKEKNYDQDIIYIGSSLPKDGTIKEFGLAIELGTNAYFSYVNKHNLLKNKEIKLLTFDDNYEPQITLENTKTLISNPNIFALYGFVGTATVKNILPLLDNENIPFISAYTGASFLRDGYYKNIVNLRSSYDQEIEEHIKYLHKVKGLSKIAVFYQNDEYGEEGYLGVLKSIKKYNLSLVAEGSYKRNTLSIRHAFYEIQNANPEAIIMVGANKPNTLFIKKAKENRNFKDTVFCNISFGAASDMVKELEGKTTNLIFSQVVPHYNNMNIPIIQEYHKVLKEYNPNYEPGFISLEAFLNAKAIVTALQNTQGPITRSRFIQEFKNLSPNTFEGLQLKYKNKQLLNKVYLFQYEKNTFKKIVQ